MHRSIVFATDALAPLPSLARAAEAAGFHRLWTTEFPDRDALVRALAIAHATDTIGVATGITYSFTRHPLALAATALDVHELSGGRLTLGLGAATAGMRRRWYGIEEDRALGRFAETVAILRGAWAANGEFRFDGEFFHARVDHLAMGPRLRTLAPVSVYGSGVNAAMLRTVAASCDGSALHPIAAGPRYLADVVAPILASRDGGLKAAAWMITSIDDDEVVARQRAAGAIAFFFSTPGYEPAAAGEPWSNAPAAIRERFLATRGDWRQAAEVVPDEMIDALSLAGTPAAVRDRLGELEGRLAAAGVDELVFQTVGVGLSEAELVANCSNIIAACAPS
ncbi:MAG: LLM class flavin-dependent oxidoreductase [Acidimicrobiia bacterium]|nr:LLM class flavin-dependent oxidoreductase [Acidimicrobiia bacterium]